MRADAFGLFWEDAGYQRKKAGEAGPRKTPPVPDTGWTPPDTLPRLSEAKALAIDIETYDPNLKSKGPGDIRGDGYIAGIAVGTDDGYRGYFPMRHQTGGLNFDPDQVLRWARDELCTKGQPKVGANLRYDLGWLAAEGVHVQGPYIDVQVAEPLLDEHSHRYDLDFLAERWLHEHKVDDELYKWLARAFGGDPDRRQAANIYYAPPQLVGPYAEGDVDLPLRIWEQQRKQLEREELLDVFDLESRLIPLLMDMRRQGVRVDLNKTEQVRETLNGRKQEAQRTLERMSGRGVNVWAPESLARAFDAAGVQYPRTGKGNPSFRKEWLEAHPSNIAKAVNTVRRYDKTINTFLDGYILGHEINGRIHAQFNQLKSDDGGTVSGRFSSSDPNLQNLPARDPELGPLIRGLFIPEEGEDWWKLDFSQIEYRFLAHYAMGPGAAEVRHRYNSDPTTDFHQMTSDLIREVTGTELDRKSTKNINFGLVYGMGADKLARSLGVPIEEANVFLEAYHEGAPFVRRTYNKADDRAAQRGFIRTFGGRKCRYPFWEPKGYHEEEPLPYEEAVGRWGPRRIRRGYTRKALNNLLQGSSADQIKRAMVDLYEAGHRVPLLTVHDELNFSLSDRKEAEEIRETMESCYTLRVPVKSDMEVGPSWGEVKEVA
jgi:DNA polymerase I-like protein with 3'-5' exonuclease and polymerase domains